MLQNKMREKKEKMPSAGGRELKLHAKPAPFNTEATARLRGLNRLLPLP